MSSSRSFAPLTRCKSFTLIVLIALLMLAPTALADPELRAEALRLFGRLEPPAATLTAEAELGRALFWDTRISRDGKTACASCHVPQAWGADSRRFSTDARGKLTSRHSQTVFNTMGQPALRWVGDRKTGADQAEGSMTGSMGFDSKEAAVAKMKELQYIVLFRKAYPDDPEPLNPRNYGRALQAYQATLVTPAAFDRFLAGDDAALTPRQKSGLRAFVSTGCAGCHSGALVGGTALHKFGLTKDYWTETGSDKIDEGRFRSTKKEEDRFVFRVPTLRNIAKTAPYFHDGSVPTLDRAVRVMAAVQLGRTLDDKTAGDIVAFLESLTGEVPAHYAPPKALATANERN
ncbi:MAG TPA: cytochrome c peroxidase [Burkholderiales bacterium]|nr:cytochrome c peroxidase [Burkholderiales bacterium]